MTQIRRLFTLAHSRLLPWFTAVSQSLADFNTHGLSALGLLVTAPALHRVVRVVISTARPKLRNVNRLICNAFTRAKQQLNHAARQIVEAVRSLVLGITTGVILWSLILGELVNQFAQAFRGACTSVPQMENEEELWQELKKSGFPAFRTAA
ncbi:hypothetical protein ACXR0O_23640 [Verrucomicrobiota bacterium sgz303538]